jgi:E3 ubiquitin-protein ligase RGLG
VKYVLTSIFVANSRRSLKAPERVPLPPPTGSHDAYSYGTKSFSKPTTSSSYPPYEAAQTAAPAAPSSAYDNQVKFHMP